MMTWWAGAGASLVLLCWAVGACARLRRLRAQLLSAFAAVEAAGNGQRVGATRTDLLAHARDQGLTPAAMAALTVERLGLQAPGPQRPAGDPGATPAVWPAQCVAFNEAAQAYNAAIAQFPALLLAWTLRYRTAGLLRPATGRDASPSTRRSE